MIDPGLQDRVVLVTGANNPYGIGTATARAFAAQGARIFLHYYRVPTSRADDSTPATEPGEAFYRAQSATGPEAVLRDIRERGGVAEAWEIDLADPEAASALLDRAESVLGPVEVLVNNAAHWEADTFVPAQSEPVNRAVEMWTDAPDPLTAGSMDRLYAVNVRAAVLLMSEFARRHAARGATWGRIINISTDGARCFPSEVSYGAGKLAMEGYTRSAAAELGQFGITVNAVAPGPVQTGWITPELERAILPNVPMGRIGQPEDIADAIVLLASQQAGWITGQRIYVGGGHAM
ncbi:MAG TPA: SDR family oxidoreductase [Chloroflexi bacterium]|nr:SDR family oxidoreductase [Chloroflexota bacterium]